jgi:hypothetical protein
MLLAYAPTAAKDAEIIKEKLAEVNKITNLGPARQFLGIEIYQENGSINLCQMIFIDSILKRFHMENAYNALTPLDDKFKLDLAEPDMGEVDPREYQAIVGSLMYIALTTTPDISFAVAALSRYNSKPYKTHLTAAKRVLRYLKAIKNPQLHYTGQNTLIGYTDSEWASDSADRKSQGGHIVISNGPISWQS